ncbi:MAG: enoyl-CoA hydratase-related protein [Bacteroidetes bacterium]|nr:enoyl-CoA hydratase-related protein [Bacteroidota bacterium]
MSYSSLLVEIDSSGIAIVTINRPDKLNALNAEVIAELDDWFSKAASDPTVKGVILTGSGPKSFVAGADISRFKGLGAEEGQRFAAYGQQVFSKIEHLGKPVIAAVNGFALGGGSELALACHIRVASTNALFGQPEVNLGIIPGYGGTQRLPRVVGKGLATEIVLTGAMVNADRALAIGLVNHVFEPEGLMDGARKLMLLMVEKAPIAIKLTLEALQSSDLPLADGLRDEAALFGRACATEDFVEGVDAFLNKRKPEFKGR